MNPIRVIIGTGTFTCISEEDGVEPFAAPFTISFFPNGTAEGQTDKFPDRIQVLLIRDFSSPRFTKFSLHGTTNDGATIEIEEIAVNSFGTANSLATFVVFSTISIHYPGGFSGECEARYGLTNLLFTGCQYQYRDDGRRWLDSVSLFLNDGSFELRRVQDFDTVSTEMKATKQTRVTAEVLCIIPFENRERWDGVVDDIAWLSSFAASEEVVPIYREFYFQGRLILCELLTRHRIPYTGGVATIPLNCPVPCSLRVFLESGYPQFTKLREDLSLQGMFYLYVKSQHPELALEVRYIMMVMALESLCSHTETILKNDLRNVPRKSIERTQNAIRKVARMRKIPLDEAIIVEMGERAAFPHPDFRDKLQCALKEFSIAYTDSDLASNNIRDTIVHTGDFPSECDPVEEYHALSNLLIRIILTVLDYRGDYVRRGAGFPLEPLPREP
jgi:hypothetical protein